MSLAGAKLWPIANNADAQRVILSPPPPVTVGPMARRGRRA